MQMRELGQSGLQVSKLCFGGNVFGWTVDEKTSFSLLDAFVGAGLNFVDTADVYSRWKPGNQGGESEAIIGNWFKQSGKRAKVILATKVGMDMGAEKKGLAKKYIFKAVEDSLRRLQTDYIDLYQSHTDDKDVPLEETLSAYGELIKQGKVRAIGASNYDGTRLSQAVEAAHKLKIPSYQSLQPLYSLCERAYFEEHLEPVCVAQKIGVISYFSLASGFLTGKYRTTDDLKGRERGTRVEKYLNDKGFGILKALDDVAARTQSTPAQVSLAWLMARPSVTAPIASATSLVQLEDLLKSTELALDATSISELNKAST